MLKTIPEDLINLPSNFRFDPFSRFIQPIIEEVLREHGKDKYRKDTKLKPLVVIWLVLVLTLRRDLNYTKALNWMLSGTRWLLCQLPEKIAHSSTITRARVKMGINIFRDIFYKFVLTFASLPKDFYQYCTVSFDGTTLTMPDTEENCEKFKKPGGKGGEGAFPQMRAVALMIMPLRIIFDIAYAPYKGKKTGERTLMFEILKRIVQENLLYLFDAGFYSFFLAYYMLETNKAFIMKLSKNIKLKPIPGSRFHDGSYLAKIKGKVNGENKKINVRVITFKIPNFPPCRLITSIFDSDISARDIAIHYHKRWDIEIAFDEIKTHQCATLRGQAPTILRSKCPDLVEQELYAILISYNLIRGLMCEATNQEGGDPLLISFLDSLHWIIEGAPFQTFCRNDDSITSQKLNSLQYSYTLKLIANSLIDRPRRPRINPRVVKVKMSKFKRRRKGDKTEYRNFEKELEIITQLAA